MVLEAQRLPGFVSPGDVFFVRFWHRGLRGVVVVWLVWFWLVWLWLVWFGLVWVFCVVEGPAAGGIGLVGRGFAGSRLRL